MTTVSLGPSLVLAGGPADAGTPGWYFTLLGDWDATSESKSDIDERDGANGAFANVQDFRTALPYSVHGVFLGASRLEVQAAKKTLKSVVSRGRTVPVTVADADSPWTRYSSCRKVTPGTDNGGNEWDFVIDFVAYDPVMYGPETAYPAGVATSGGGLLCPLGTNRTTGLVDPTAPFWDFGADSTSGKVSVTNNGSAPIFPKLTATGGLSGGFVATDTALGKTVTFARLIPINSQVTIDQRTERAWIDDPANDVSGYITSNDSDFFSIGPGETHIIQFAPLGVVTGTPIFSAIAADGNL